MMIIIKSMQSQNIRGNDPSNTFQNLKEAMKVLPRKTCERKSLRKYRNNRENWSTNMKIMGTWIILVLPHRINIQGYISLIKSDMKLRARQLQGWSFKEETLNGKTLDRGAGFGEEEMQGSDRIKKWSTSDSYMSNIWWIALTHGYNWG